MNEGGQARRDQLKQVPQLNGQQFTPDSETQAGSELDDENALARHLRLIWMQFIKGFACGGLAVWLLMR